MYIQYNNKNVYKNFKISTKILRNLPDIINRKLQLNLQRIPVQFPSALLPRHEKCDFD